MHRYESSATKLQFHRCKRRPTTSVFCVHQFLRVQNDIGTSTTHGCSTTNSIQPTGIQLESTLLLYNDGDRLSLSRFIPCILYNRISPTQRANGKMEVLNVNFVVGRTFYHWICHGQKSFRNISFGYDGSSV